mgnify:CR=1 FL=1
MFSNNADVKVLESKLSIYEDLSREMLTKLENAVDKISESNARIANILTKHDERIDQSIRSDELIIKMIEDHKQYDDDMFEKVSEKFNRVEEKINILSKFRWQAGAIAAVFVVIVSFGSPIVLTIMDNLDTIEERVIDLP